MSTSVSIFFPLQVKEDLNMDINMSPIMQPSKVCKSKETNNGKHIIKVIANGSATTNGKLRQR